MTTFVQCDARPQAPLASTPFQTWTLPGGREWTQFHRLADGYLLRFPGLADFTLSADASGVECIPVPGIGRESIYLLFNNQVLPLALSWRDKLVLHASAVQVGHGAIAFIAESGRGKSTLAAEFATNGYACVADDGLVVDVGAEQVFLMPSAPSLRLWDDSLAAVVGDDARCAPSADYTSKSRVLATESLPFTEQPRLANRLYFLGTGQCESPTFSLMPPSEALVELVKHSFLLDIEQQNILKTHFDALTRLVRQPLCYRLDYPRRYDALTDVRSAILRHVGLQEVA